MKSAVQRAQRAQIKGIKIQVAGRLNGAEIARSEWIRKGQVQLQTLQVVPLLIALHGILQDKSLRLPLCLLMVRIL